MAKGAQVQLFGVGVGEPAKSLNVTAASRTNVYYDIQPAPGDKSQISVFGTPGLTLLGSLPNPDLPINAAYSLADGSRTFFIQDKYLYEINIFGISSQVATLSSAPIYPCEMADNGVELLITTWSSYTYCFDLASNTLQIAVFDGTPGQYVEAVSCTFQDGYFIVALTKDNTPGYPRGVYVSALYSGMSWSSLDFAVPEFMSDEITKVYSKNGLLYVFGTRTTEVWQNIGDLNFPFQRVQGAQSEYGIFARMSLISVGSQMAGLFLNRQNSCSIMMLSGYQFNDITPPDLSWRLNSQPYLTLTTSFAYSVAGHDFVQFEIVDATGTDGETWLYDTLSGVWSFTKSGSNSRHLGRYGVAFFNQAAQYVVTDYRNGNFYTIDSNSYSDNGETNERELIGNHIFLPDRGTFRISSISLDIEQGSAPTGVDMRVRLSLSRDGGHTFEEEYEDVSTTGEYTRFFQFNRLGRARDIVPKIRMTDPCKFVLIGAVADIAPYGW